MRVKIVSQTRLPDPYGPVWADEVLEMDDKTAKHLVMRGIAKESEAQLTREVATDQYAAAEDSPARREVTRQNLYTAAIHGDVRAARQLDDVDADLAARAREGGTAAAIDVAARERRWPATENPETTTEAAPESLPGGTAGGERTTATGAAEETEPRAKADREKNQAEARAKIDAEQASAPRAATPARQSTGASARQALAKK